MSKLLSILIPTLPILRQNSYSLLIDELKRQIQEYNLSDKVQILSIGDTKEMSVGEKRNWLVQMSKGKYILFIDDDDKVVGDFIPKIMAGIDTDSDCVTFHGWYYENGNFINEFMFSHMVREDNNTKEMLYRIPNHLCAVKREIAIQCKFPDQNFAEDSAYAKLIKQFIKTDHHINEKLYHYYFNISTSQTHNRK